MQTPSWKCWRARFYRVPPAVGDFRGLTMQAKPNPKPVRHMLEQMTPASEWVRKVRMRFSNGKVGFTWFEPRSGSQNIRGIPALGLLRSPSQFEDLVARRSVESHLRTAQPPPLSPTDRFPSKVDSDRILLRWRLSTTTAREARAPRKPCSSRSASLRELLRLRLPDVRLRPTHRRIRSSD